MHTGEDVDIYLRHALTQDANFTLGFAAALDSDLRRYNNPQGDQLAVVFPSDDGAPQGSRDLVVWPRTAAAPIFRISDRNEHVDPLTYALLFPFGTPGWHDHLQHAAAHRTQHYTRLTAGQFYTHRLMVRDFDAALPHGAGLLLQQYILDGYCRAEAMRMAWFRQHQRQLRSEVHDELYAYVHNADVDGSDDAGTATPGVPIILPSSYAGSPRNMYQLYLDAMAIVRKCGRPAYFITFTANPQWPEIRDHLLPGQQPGDRPDLVARVFQMRLKALLQDLTQHNWLGEAVAWTWVVEFQKRGLPHAHILLIVSPSHKPTTPEAIDARVCAEIPLNVNSNQSQLVDLVKRCMLHGPCGVRNPAAPCIREDGACKANFPKEFADTTFVHPESYPAYRRRDLGATVQKGQNIFDNRDVVPYSPILLKKYGAHCNVEVVSNIRLVKYIFKYAYKGHDRAHVELRHDDEIQQHIDARYLGACEAAWRLFEFPIHGSSHTVERLALHLPGQHTVVFAPGAEDDALDAPRGQITTLLAWFELNSRIAQNQTDSAKILSCLYQDIPTVCVWNRSQRQWTPRCRHRTKDTRVIGRLPAINPAAGEKYYLYLLLLTKPGATSFADLKTVTGILHETFQAAAIAAGLCDSDQHYHDAVSDALSIATPKRARSLLALILACCDVADPLNLWTTFQEDLSQDFQHAGMHLELACDAALEDLQKHLTRHGLTCQHFSLPMPSSFDLQAYRFRELRAELEYDAAAEAAQAQEMRESMDSFPLQAEAFDAIVHAIDNNEGAIFFVDGPGGSGKSFLFEAILHYVRGLNEIAVACAWNGLAAALLPGGRTCHARFGFPVPLPRYNVPWNVTARSGKGQLLARSRVLLWDEIGTAPAAAVDAADACLQDLCDNSSPFGGKVVVFGGDLRQTLPVVELGDRNDIVASAFVSSSVWQQGLVKRLRLPFNIRAAEDAPFRDFLLRIGNGQQERDLELGPNAVVLPQHIVAPNSWSIVDLLTFVYSDLVTKFLLLLHTNDLDSIRDLSSRAILTPRNDAVSDLNQIALDLFSSAEPMHQLCSTTTISGGSEDDYNNFPVRII